jgi:hypothetical protein
MLKVQKKDNKQNRIINDTYSFGLTTNELHLQLQSDVYTFAAIIETITYRRYLVQLPLFITTFAISAIINLGYSTLTQLDIKSMSKTIFVKTRINVSN